MEYRYDINENDYDNEEDAKIVFDPEEPSKTKNNIIICELYNERMHGRDDSEVNSHYLVHTRFKILEMNYINDYLDEFREIYANLIIANHKSIRSHNIFKNYNSIVRRRDYIKPEIAQCIYLKSDHMVAILKTFWIRLIQRTWKNVFKNRKEILQKRCSLSCLNYRTIHGVWPEDISYLPSLQGILHNI
jgi:hypothetical protein